MTHDALACNCPRCLGRVPGSRAGTALERMVDDAFDEVVAVARRSAESDFGALSHALGQVWRDTPQPLKAYLMLRARTLLQHLGRDPRALLWRVLGLSLHYMQRRGMDKALAVRRAVSTVARTTARPRAARSRLGTHVQVKAYQQRLRQRSGRDPARGSGRHRRFEAPPSATWSGAGL